MQTLEDVLGSRVNLTILRYLTAIRGGLSGNEIAKRLRLQQSSVRQALERLVETGVVTRSDVGRSAAYELDHRLVFVRRLLIPLFRAEAGLYERLMATLARHSEKLQPRPRSVILFGSLARGDRSFRDVDLLCIVASERDKARLHDTVAATFEQVRRDYAVPVSAIIASEAEIRSTKLEAVSKEVRRDGILLFGSAPAELRDVRAWNRQQNAAI